MSLYEDIKVAAKKHLNIDDLDPEVRMNTVEIIQHWGYSGEAHNVTTKDGYILEMHRISNNEIGDKIPILLQHGFLGSSADWVLNLKNQSLGFMLSDAKYDVWLGNVRGNTYGRQHTHLNPNDSEFWKFSWDEMGAYDVPAMIDYVLNTTGHEQLYYVGHSMGTTVAFAMLATKAEYNDKIKEMFALAPVASMANNKQKPLIFAASYYKEILLLLRPLNIKVFLPNNYIVKYIAETACRYPQNTLCADIIFKIAGNDSAELNRTRLPVYFTHTPAGQSLQTLAHFAQLINSKNWQHYDWGYLQNYIKYGSIYPPLYDATKITAPVCIIYGLNDPLADPDDVAWLTKQLSNITENYQVKDKLWNHLDFILGINAGPKVNAKIIEILSKNN